MYSQLGQDRLVFELLGGKRGGFFLDSGAADGVIASNTYVLETDLGWTGICVEPNPVFFAQLVKTRTSHCVNCCLYDRDGTVEFVDAAYLGGIRETYEPTHLEQIKTLTRSMIEPARVMRPARTLRSVLREFDAPRVIDYWSLDTEGSELAILKSFPFEEYTFRVLTVEHNRLPVRHEIRALLEPRGYHLACSLDIDDVYTWGQVRPAWRSGAWSR